MASQSFAIGRHEEWNGLPRHLGMSIPYAAPHEWDLHRKKITDLYMKQRLSLAQITETMKVEHGFIATGRMYKDRFQKWGLRKYNIQNTKARAPRLRGPNKVAEYRHPTPIACRRPSPVNISILFPFEAPQAVRQPEESMYLIRAYIDNAFSTGEWKPDQDLSVYESESEMYRHWYYQMMLAGDMIIQQGHTKDAFRMIQKCFDLFKEFTLEMKATPDPRMFIQIFSGIIYLCDLPELTRMILKFAAGLFRMKAGSAYPPLSLVMDRMAHMSVNEFNLSCRHILDYYFDLLEFNLYPSSEIIAVVTNLRGIAILNTALKNLIDIRVAEEAYDKLLEKYDTMPQAKSLYRVKTVLQRLNLYSEKHMFDKAKQLIAEIQASDYIQENSDFLPYLKLPLLDMARAEEDVDEILRLAPGFIEEWVIKYGKGGTIGGRPEGDKSIELRALGLVEQYLRELGREKEAEEIKRDFDAAMDETFQSSEANVTVDGSSLSEAINSP